MPQLTVQRTDEPREVTTKYGIMYSYNVHGLLDGKEANGSHLTKAPETMFQVGQTYDVTVEDTQYGLKFKKVQTQPSFAGNFGGRRPDEASKYPSFALAYAKDIIVARGVDADEADWFPLADKALAWLESKQAHPAPSTVPLRPPQAPSASAEDMSWVDKG